MATAVDRLLQFHRPRNLIGNGDATQEVCSVSVPGGEHGPIMPSDGALEALIAALVRMLRPATILGIGADDSAALLALAAESAIHEQPNSRYRPAIVVFEHNTSVSAAATRAHQFLSEQQERFDFLERRGTTVFDEPLNGLDRLGCFDLVFVATGSIVDHARLLRILWPRIAPGGVLAFRNPYLSGSELDSTPVPHPLWAAILHSHPDDVEVFSVPLVGRSGEMGIGLVRRRFPSETPSVSSFEREMAALCGAPIPFTHMNFHNPDRLADQAVDTLRMLADPSIRSVVFAVGSGSTSVSTLQSRLSMTQRKITAAVARLSATGVLVRAQGGLAVSDEFWSRFLALEKRAPSSSQAKPLTDRALFLGAIANHLSPTDWVEESHVNELCSLFDPDFATLRRELVDKGHLVRAQGRYKRAV
ncbi:putative O-methyltransferase YrrM [Nocardia sp. GAS34]|uniref:DUF2087 domain-containing protein n=1 Tax=unclassified Nocardia TaxID=2637762 RepID=UPI003D204A2B